MFQNFAHSLFKKKKKKKKQQQQQLFSKTLAYFSINSRVELFFPALFFFINKKYTTVTTNRSICDSFLILSIFPFPFYVFLVFLSI